MYWTSWLFFVGILCKMIVLNWHDVGRVFLILISFATCVIDLWYQIILKPLQPANEWDPNVAEEREAKAAREAASKVKDERAKEILATITDEAERQAFLEKEAARKEAERQLELQYERQRLFSQRQSRVRLPELKKMLRPYFWPDGLGPRLSVFLTWAALIGSKVSSIIGPLYIGYAVSSLVNDNIVPWKYIIVYCLFQFLNSGLKQLQNAIYLRVKQEAFVQIAQFTFRHLHSLSLNWHLKKKMGNVLRAMDRGIASADTLVNWLFLYMVPSLAEGIVVFTIFFVHFGQPILSAVIFIHLTMYVVVTIQITIWRKKFRQATNRHDNKYHEKASDSLINYETVKYFGNEDYETKRYVESIRHYQGYNISTQTSLAILNTLQALIIQLSLMFALCIAAYQITRGKMSIGDFSAVTAYTLNLFAPLSFLGSIYDGVVQAFVDMQTLSELLAEEPDVTDKPGAPDLVLHSQNRGAMIEFKNVCFKYQDAPYGLEGISFVVKPGTTTAIVGSTGAGKSTIGRLLFRFYDVHSGSIEIDGQDIRDVTQKSLRRCIGVVPQDTVMFNESILHNIRYGNVNATMDQVEEAARNAQILEFIERQKLQWETMVGERGLRLSGGEKQRVAIARALLKDPPIVLLDEATSALDSVKEQEIQSALLRLEKGRTTLVIAHRLSTIKHAEQIIVLERGHIVEKGTHHELLRIPNGRYAQLWNQQASSAFESAREQEELTSSSTSPVTIRLDDE